MPKTYWYDSMTELSARIDAVSAGMTPGVSAGQYGALGDGVTDDAPAIQAALTAMANAGGGTVVLDNGTYLIGSTLTIDSNVALAGQSPFSTTLKLKNATNVDIIQTVAFEANTGTTNLGKSRFVIRDLGIDGNRANNTIAGRGMALYGFAYKVLNVWIHDTPTTGFYSEQANSGLPANHELAPTIDGLTVGKSGHHGIHYKGPTDGRFVTCWIHDNGQAAYGTTYYNVYVDGGTAAASQFVNCHFWGESAKNGLFVLNAGYCQFDAVTVEGATEAQILVHTYDCRFDAMTVYKGFGAIQKGIQIGTSGTYSAGDVVFNGHIRWCPNGAVVFGDEWSGAGSKINAVVATDATGDIVVSGTPSPKTELDIYTPDHPEKRVYTLASGYRAGNWPRSTWRPYDTESAWNTPVPATPTLDPNSAAIVTQLRTHGTANSDGIFPTSALPHASDVSHPVFWSQATDPYFTLAPSDTTSGLSGMQIRIPDFAQAAGGSDSHMTVIDQKGGWEYNLYAVTSKPAGGGTIAFTRGERIALYGDSRGSGSTAADVGNMAGIIRAQELEDGLIDHALFLIVEVVKPDVYRYPAKAPSGTTSVTANEPTLGMRLWLDRTPAQIEALSIPTWRKTILKALAKYGAYICDTMGTGNSRCFKVAVESDQSYKDSGTTGQAEAFAIANSIAISGGQYRFDIETGVAWDTYLRVLPRPSVPIGKSNARVYKSVSPQSIPHNTSTQVIFEGWSFDDLGEWDATNNRITAMKKCRMRASVGLRTNGAASTWVISFRRYNAAHSAYTELAAASFYVSGNASILTEDVVPMAPGEHLEVWVNQFADDALAKSLTNVNRNWLTIEQVHTLTGA